ncbi:MAG: winged helix-turn-helix domain-containing protein [Burkholderiales bacterium]|nr:winged helix-turn-helix domain-containing protein [Burkholderiales bacterium]
MFSDTLSPPDTASEPPRSPAAVAPDGPPDAAASPLYAWDDLLLDVCRRQLSRSGVPLPLEARALAAMAHLVQFRHRVVSADELRQAVWQDRPNVTDNAIMRAISQARAALGESGRDGCIRTVPRVGYRFTGALHGAAVGSASGAPGPLALLAFENATGDARLAWVELGLMALTIHLLGGGVGGTGVLPPGTVMQALHLASGPSREARQEAMLRVAPAARVVHTVVTACDGGFLARCQVPGEPDAPPSRPTPPAWPSWRRRWPRRCAPTSPWPLPPVGRRPAGRWPCSAWPARSRPWPASSRTAPCRCWT